MAIPPRRPATEAGPAPTRPHHAANSTATTIAILATAAAIGSAGAYGYLRWAADNQQRAELIASVQDLSAQLRSIDARIAEAQAGLDAERQELRQVQRAAEDRRVRIASLGARTTAQAPWWLPATKAANHRWLTPHVGRYAGVAAAMSLAQVGPPAGGVGPTESADLDRLTTAELIAEHDRLTELVDTQRLALAEQERSYDAARRQREAAEAELTGLESRFETLQRFLWATYIFGREGRYAVGVRADEDRPAKVVATMPPGVAGYRDVEELVKRTGQPLLTADPGLTDALTELSLGAEVSGPLAGKLAELRGSWDFVPASADLVVLRRKSDRKRTPIGYLIDADADSVTIRWPEHREPLTVRKRDVDGFAMAGRGKAMLEADRGVDFLDYGLLQVARELSALPKSASVTLALNPQVQLSDAYISQAASYTRDREVNWLFSERQNELLSQAAERDGRHRNQIALERLLTVLEDRLYAKATKLGLPVVEREALVSAMISNEQQRRGLAARDDIDDLERRAQDEEAARGAREIIGRAESGADSRRSATAESESEGLSVGAEGSEYGERWRQEGVAGPVFGQGPYPGSIVGPGSGFRESGAFESQSRAGGFQTDRMNSRSSQDETASSSSRDSRTSLSSIDAARRRASLAIRDFGTMVGASHVLTLQVDKELAGPGEVHFVMRLGEVRGNTVVWADEATRSLSPVAKATNTLLSSGKLTAINPGSTTANKPNKPMSVPMGGRQSLDSVVGFVEAQSGDALLVRDLFESVVKRSRLARLPASALQERVSLRNVQLGADDFDDVPADNLLRTTVWSLAAAINPPAGRVARVDDPAVEVALGEAKQYETDRRLNAGDRLVVARPRLGSGGVYYTELPVDLILDQVSRNGFSAVISQRGERRTLWDTDASIERGDVVFRRGVPKPYAVIEPARYWSMEGVRRPEEQIASINEMRRLQGKPPLSHEDEHETREFNESLRPEPEFLDKRGLVRLLTKRKRQPVQDRAWANYRNRMEKLTRATRENLIAALRQVGVSVLEIDPNANGAVPGATHAVSLEFIAQNNAKPRTEIRIGVKPVDPDTGQITPTPTLRLNPIVYDEQMLEWEP